MVNHRITPMTESGLLAGITVIMALIAVYVPVLGFVAAILWPLPILVLVVRHGLRWGILAVITATALMGILIEPLLSLRLFVAFGPLGLVLGYGYRKKWSAVKLFAAAAAVSIFSEGLSLVLLFLMTGVNPFTAQLDMMKESFQQSLSVYQDMHVNELQLAQAKRDFTQGMSLVAMLLPLMVILMGMFDAVLNFFVAGKILRRLGHEVPVLPRFADWHLPKFFLYLFGFSMVGLYWGSARHFDMLYMVSLNANMLATMAGLVQGLSLFSAVADHFRLPRMLRWILLAVILFSGIFAQVLAFVGLFDMVFDYRRRFGRKDDSDMK